MVRDGNTIMVASADKKHINYVTTISKPFVLRSIIVDSVSRILYFHSTKQLFSHINLRKFDVFWIKTDIVKNILKTSNKSNAMFALYIYV